MRRIHESGRSLLEMLAVLAIVAILIIASLSVFNGLYKYYQRKDTVKQMNTIVTHYRSDKLVRRRNGKILLKDIVPGATENTLKATDGGEFILEDGGRSTFVVIKKADDGLSCQDIVAEGNYDVVGYGNTEEGFLAPEKTYSVKGAKTQLEVICNPENYQYFYYNKDRSADKDDPNPKPIVNGEIADCPNEGEIKDKNGKCCQAGAMDCGICGGCKTLNKYCASGDTCVECLEDGHCPEGQFCEDYQCVQCKDVGKPCPITSWRANTYCNSQHECETCDDCQSWNGYSCVDDAKKALNATCTKNCECESGNCQDGKCQEATCVHGTTYGAECSLGCACDSASGFVCRNNKCDCPAGKVWDADANSCVNGSCSTTFAKGASCSGYEAYKDGCCEAGLSCRDATCQCKTLSRLEGGECNKSCGCETGTELVCNDSHQCVCSSPKVWNGTKCVCPVADDTNSGKDCYEKYYPNTTLCPGYYYYRPKAEGTRCSGSCHSCDNAGNCVNRTQSWTGRTWDNGNTNCCKASATYNYCALNGETAPTACSDNKTHTTTSNSVCQVTTTTDLCTNAVLSTTYPNNGASCGECGGSCSNGTCNDTPKQSYTYNKNVNGVCTRVTETFCPAGAPSDQCTLAKTCTGCNACQTCDTSTGNCVADSSQNGKNRQSNGKCCMNGSFQFNDTYCPSPSSTQCVPLNISTTKTSQSVSVNGKSHPLYHLSYSGSITPAFDLTLHFSLYSIRNSPASPTISISGPGVNINKSYSSLPNHWSGAEFGKDYDQEVTLKAGSTYTINVNVYNLCHSCVVDTQCAWYA